MTPPSSVTASVGEARAIDLDALDKAHANAAGRHRSTWNLQIAAAYPALAAEIRRLRAENATVRSCLAEGVAIIESQPTIKNAIDTLDRFRAQVAVLKESAHA